MMQWGFAGGEVRIDEFRIPANTGFPQAGRNLPLPTPAGTDAH
jgi:hypothetical protein